MLNLNWKTLQNGAAVILVLYILPKILPWLLLFAVVGLAVWLSRIERERFLWLFTKSYIAVRDTAQR